uniref:Uncharacterized protein n=1 Tax=Haptolina brevifila TaxID=156173 RepID=A0A7S2CUP9_9EUKA|mmetsp:Transcript_29085/g.58622  ORF Transcript_29085/g.58622 Transcript_29085/m.58622 type:complete len:109 (+) Transcript_29085:3-329(+)
MQEREWLAPEQLSLLEVLAGKRNEMAGRLTTRSKYDARAASAKLSGGWRAPSRHTQASKGGSLMRLQLTSPAVPIEGVLLQKLDRRETEAGAKVLDLEAAVEWSTSWR